VAFERDYGEHRRVTRRADSHSVERAHALR
jgi:hypothetical protein